MRRAALLILVALVPVQLCAAETVPELLQRLWSLEAGVAPATPALLLWEMAQDTQRADSILEGADAASRSLSDTLLSSVELSEPLALRQLPQMHVVHDGDPAGPEKPPTWAAVRRVGLDLLERIALDADVARDRRMTRELADYRRDVRRWTPSVVGGEVELWKAWWVDRGSDSALYADGSAPPDPSSWVERSSRGARNSDVLDVSAMLPRLYEDPLYRRLYLEEIDERTHAGLVASGIRLLDYYAADFEKIGIPAQNWDPETGRLVGYDAERLREIVLDLLSRVSGFVPSGYAQHERIRNSLAWWKSARLQAVYYQDPHAAPDLAEYFVGFHRPQEAGGVQLAALLRNLYLEREIRSLLLEQYGPQHSGVVSELVAWLGYSREQAIEHGFNFSYRLRPLRRVPGQEGPLAVIVWDSVQDLIRQLLRRITQVELVEAGLPPDARNRQWAQWWLNEREDARWYRGEAPASEVPRFVPERARADEG